MSIRKLCMKNKNMLDEDYAVSFKAERMPNGNSYPEKQVFGIEAILDEMRLRNGRPWKGNEEFKMREWVIHTYPSA